MQDHDGFIWIATTKGLFRYDGYTLHIYRDNPLDRGSIGDNYIRALTEDENGVLWIGTHNSGLARYDRYQDIFIHFRHDPGNRIGLADNTINDLLIDSRGWLWIATANGLDCLDSRTGVFRNYRTSKENSDGFINDFVRCVEEDKQGMIWIGTEGKGLYRVNPHTGEYIQLLAQPDQEDSFIDDRTRTIARGEDGFLWFSTFDDPRLFRLDPITLQIKPFELTSTATNAYRPTVIKTDRKGGLWIGTHNMGLLHFWPESGRLMEFQHDPARLSSLPSNNILALWLDNTGILWIGHVGVGLSQLLTHTNNFEILPLTSPRSSNSPLLYAQCVLEDRRGNLWIGSWRNGVHKYNPDSGETTIFRHQPDNSQSLASDMVWDILEDRQGFIWFATHNGLQRFDPKSGTLLTYGQESGLRHTAIRSLLEDHTGRLWVGTFGGLHRLDAETETINFIDSFSENSSVIITEIFEDSQKGIWVAIHGAGIFYLDHKADNWIHFRKKNKGFKELSANIVRKVIEDTKGRIWLGTEGGGLNLFQPHPDGGDSSTFKHWRPYNSALPDENVFNLSVDKHNLLWLSTDLGLFSFNPKNQEVKPYALPGKTKGLNVKTRLGLSNAFYAGNTQYIYRFYPDSIQQNKHIPPVFITEFHINGRPIPVQGTFGDSLPHSFRLRQSILYTSALELAHWQNDLAFVFSALNYIEPGNNSYRYMMQGYDDHWNETGASNRHIRYTNLAPGQYTFHVMAANNEGFWNTEGKKISIRIYPPWWRTTWATLLWITLISGIIYSVYHFQLNRRLTLAENQRLHELDTLKTKFYNNITHEFRTPLTVILGMAEQLRTQASEHRKEGITLIKRNGRQLLKMVNQMLDLSKLESGHLSLNPEQGDVINYIQYLLESFHSLAETRNIRLHFLSSLNQFYMDFDSEQLMHIVSNLLSNAIKFTPEGKDVYVAVETLRGIQAKLEIRVKDTGIGIPEEKLPFIFDRFYQLDDSTTRSWGGTGIGLTLTKELVKLMGGEIEVSSELGKGTIFSVQLPVKNSQPMFKYLPTIDSSVPIPPLKITVQNKTKKSDQPLLLIVEDNSDLVKYLDSCLNGQYNLEIAYDGEQGISKAKDLIPDLILTDVMMPLKDGYELCQTLKNEELTSHIPIVMLTAKVDAEARILGRRQGADTYLVKPFLKEELEVIIEGLLLQRQKLQHHFSKNIGLEIPTQKPSDNSFIIESQFLKKVNNILEKNLTNTAFSVADLCDQLFISQSKLYRKIMALTGMSPQQYIRSVRLQKAKELLQHTTQSIHSIAFDTGFSDPHYFSRIFKKETGMTPTQFRKKG